MKRIVIAGSVVALLIVVVGVVVIYIRRDEPTITCVPLDHGTRTRHFCIMNPFRDRRAEAVAEYILEQLKAGNTNVLVPYLSEKEDDDRERYLSNESEYRITSWHNGEVDINGEELSIQYRVSRRNHPGDEIHFFFARTEGQWMLRSYNAIY